MDGIVYVFHGSQKEEKNQAAMAFINQLKQRFTDGVLQETAFLENHAHTIEKQTVKLIEQGANRVLIVPVLLFAAKHALKDIPEELKPIQKRYPKVIIEQAPTFGSRSGSRKVLLDRFLEARKAYSISEPTGILIAHGTKMTEEPQQILEEIAEEIETVAGFPVRAVNLKGHGDYIAEIAKLLETGRQPIIVPFFLFDGHLIHLMKQRLAEAFPEHELIVTSTLEFDERLLDDLADVVKEVL